MAYTQIYIHVVFAVKFRESLITEQWRERLHKYITGIINNQGGKSLAVGGWKDHVHIFFGMNPTIALSDLIRTVKSNSSKWINEQNLTASKFQWQESYGAFSYSRSHIDNVINYITNQESHHKTKTFKEEYLEMLKNFNIDYEEKYLFSFIEE